MQGVARGDDHDASSALPHPRAGSPEEEPARGASDVGDSGSSVGVPSAATALRANSRVVNALSGFVALVR